MRVSEVKGRQVKTLPEATKEAISSYFDSFSPHNAKSSTIKHGTIIQTRITYKKIPL